VAKCSTEKIEVENSALRRQPTYRVRI